VVAVERYLSDRLWERLPVDGTWSTFGQMADMSKQIVVFAGSIFDVLLFDVRPN
jgi:hypothetical protein